MRRFLRIVAVLMLLAVVVGGIAVWYLLSDQQRLTALIVETVRKTFALEMTVADVDVTLIPRPGLKLEGVSLRSAGAASAAATEPALAKARAITVAVTWRTLFGGDVEFTKLSLHSPEVDGTALDRWLSAYTGADIGPPTRWQWPRIDTDVEVYEGRFTRDDGTTVDHVRVKLAPLEHNGRLSVFVWFDRGGRYFATLAGIPRNMPFGIQLDEFDFTVQPTSNRPEDVKTHNRQRLNVTGAADVTSATAWEFRGYVKMQELPGDLLPISLATPVDLLGGVERDGNRFGVAARGLYGASNVDGYVFDIPIDAGLTPPALLEAIARRTGGRMDIDRLEIEGVQLEGLRLEASPEPVDVR